MNIRMMLSIVLGNLMEMKDGTWGMFVDDFPPELWDKLVKFLKSEDSWMLDKDVEMSLECEEPRVYKYYP